MGRLDGKVAEITGASPALLLPLRSGLQRRAVACS